MYIQNTQFNYVIVTESTLNSDHKAIVASSNLVKPNIKKTSKTYLIRTRTPTQIGLFHECISQTEFQIRSDNPQVLYNHLYDNLRNILDLCFPLRTVTLSSKDPAFVTPYIKILLRQKNRFMRSGRLREAKNITERIRKIIIHNNSKQFQDLKVQEPKKLWAAIRKNFNTCQSEIPKECTLTADQLNDHYTTKSTDSSYEEPKPKMTRSVLKVNNLSILTTYIKNFLRLKKLPRDPTPYLTGSFNCLPIIYIIYLLIYLIYLFKKL